MDDNALVVEAWNTVLFDKFTRFKHLLIAAMIGAGFWFNAILRVGPMLSSQNSAVMAYTRFRSFTYIMAISGVLVLLLTALAQVQ